MKLQALRVIGTGNEFFLGFYWTLGKEKQNQTTKEKRTKDTYRATWKADTT